MMSTRILGEDDIRSFDFRQADQDVCLGETILECCLQ